MYGQNTISRTQGFYTDAHVFKKYCHLSRERTFNIMIIDDSKKDIQLFEDLLSAESHISFHLSKWTNPNDGLLALRNKEIRPDLIVLDLLMPIMNGRMVLKSIKEMSDLSLTPVVIHSSMNNYENNVAMSILEAHAFFAKPLNVELFEDFLLGEEF